MQLCEGCQKQPFKYKCPRCSFKSCSLDCSKSHKIRTGCSGERSKTHFVARKQYTYNDMMSDYGYLEDMSRQADTLSRLNMKADPQKAVSKNAIMKQKELVKQAKRAGIMLSMLPAGLKRRKINCTNYSPKQQTIFWTIECLFVSCDRKRVLLHRIPSSKSMREILDDLLTSDTQHDSDALTRFQLKSYIDAGSDSYIIGLKKEFVPADQQNTFINVTPMMDAPLLDVLKGESLCEFPTLHIWLHDADPTVNLEEKSEKQSFRGLTGLIGAPHKAEQPKQEVEPEPMDEVEDDTESSSKEELDSSDSGEAESSDDEDVSSKIVEEAVEETDEKIAPLTAEETAEETVDETVEDDSTSEAVDGEHPHSNPPSIL